MTFSEEAATSMARNATRAMPSERADGNADVQSVRTVLGVLSDKWTLEIIFCLWKGPQHFGGLRRTVVGISHRVLTVVVRKLEREGLVSRRQIPGSQARIEYSLTPVGQSLVEQIKHLSRWADHHSSAMADARMRAAVAKTQSRR